MANVHVVLGWIAVAGAVAVIVAGATAALGRHASRIVLDRAILVQMATAAAAAAAGLPLPVAGSGLADPLHLLYAVVAVGGVGTARYIARDRDMRGMGRWVAIAGIVVMGALLRLFMTGR